LNFIILYNKQTKPKCRVDIVVVVITIKQHVRKN